MTKGWDQAAVDRANERKGLSAEEMGARIRAGIPTPPDMIHGGPIAIMAKATTEPRAKKMNKTEAAYEQVLIAEKRAQRILDYKFEGMTLKLGDDCRFTPDFFVVDCDGFVQLHDCKGYWKKQQKVHVEDDAKVKLAVAASTIFPYFEFRTVWQENGTWQKRIH